MSKKLSKHYKKTMKYYKKRLVKIAKATKPWDFGWLLDFIRADLSFMAEYYEYGENVYAEDINNDRCKTLYEALYLYDLWINFNIKNYSKFKNFNREDYNNLCESEQKLIKEEIDKLYAKQRMEFFKYLGKHIEDWWD